MTSGLSGLKLLAATAAIFTVLLVFQTDARACACCETYAVHNVPEWDVLNVRSGPGTKYNVVGTLHYKEGCIGLSGEERGNWVYIYANESGLEGWVNSKYLKFRPHGSSS